MPTGTIKFFNSQKGFGFIVADEGNREIFLPLASLAGMDAAKLKPGQRLSFEIETEARGPKAVSLTLLERAPPPVLISLFHDPSDGEAEDVLAALQAQGCQVREVNILAHPPSPQELKNWSLQAGAGRGLVRRFHPMFHALQLDDRFIGQDEFWTAVSEHPVLIETPLLVSRNKVRVCYTAEDVGHFLDPAPQAEAAPKPKGLSPRLAALIRGEAVPARPAPEPEEPEGPEETESAAPPAPARTIAPPQPAVASPAPKLQKTPEPAAPKAAPPEKKPLKAAAKKAAPARKTAPAAKPAPAKKPAPAAKAKPKAKAPAKKTRR